MYGNATIAEIRLGEIWMILKDRKTLAKLMVIQHVSQRQLAKAAGWKAHSHLTRLLNGQARTLGTEPALRIAHHLGVGVDDLFLVGATSDAARSAQRQRTVA